MGTGPAFTLYLTSYEYSKYSLNKYEVRTPYHQNMKRYPSLISFISGMMAEAISCVFWLPIDVIKERMQVQSTIKIFNYKNTIDAFRTIIKSEGVVGLYRAYGATIASFGPFSAFYFMFYEKLKTFLDNPSHPTFLESLVTSGGAGAMAGFICNPLELVKLRMQVQRASKATQQTAGDFGYRNLFHGLYLIVKNEGILALTKGSLMKVMHACPNTAVTMSVAEVSRSYFMDRHKRNRQGN